MGMKIGEKLVGLKKIKDLDLWKRRGEIRNFKLFFWHILKNWETNLNQFKIKAMSAYHVAWHVRIPHHVACQVKSCATWHDMSDGRAIWHADISLNITYQQNSNNWLAKD